VIGTMGAVVEVNSETDFVAKNEQFQDFVRNVAQIALATGNDIDELARAQYPGHGTVSEVLTGNIATIGENQSLRRAARLEVADGVIVSYVHNAVAPGLGKIGVLVALESGADKAALEALGKQLAMHIAAANPLAMDGAELDPDLVERERTIAQEKAPRPASRPRSSQDGRRRARQVPQGKCAAFPAVRDGQQDQGQRRDRGRGEAPWHRRRADRLRPLPAWRRHRAQGKRLRGRGRRGFRCRQARAGRLIALAGWRVLIKVRATVNPMPVTGK
jgi:translation elongation factor EF-Ts